MYYQYYLCLSDPIGITGGLSGQLDVKNTKGEMYEETLTWSVDSQVGN